MAVFFNGRLWISPATMSAVNDNAMADRNLSVSNILAIVGPSTGGKPNTPLRFGSPSEARATLISGDLLDAIERAFAPSAQTGSPAEIVGVRVNPATQATLTLVDGNGNDVIVLTSTDYGLRTNQTKAKVEAGSATGKKITTQLANDYYVGDNLARNAFLIRYAGAALSAVITVTNTVVTLQAPSGNDVASLALSTFDTVQKLVDRINAVAGFTATVLDGNGDTAALNGLDQVTSQDVKTADFTVTANLQACIDWINSTGEGFVTAARATNGGAVPANLGFTYLTGGSDGTITNTEWTNALTTLQSVDVQWVVPATTSGAIHAAVDAHCIYMSAVARQERRAIVGTALGTSDAAAIAAAKALNSDRTGLVHIGIYDYDRAGKLKLYPPYIPAAMVAGMFAGSNPGTPMTNKAIRCQGLERKLRNPTDTDQLILGGVLCIEDTPRGYRVVKSISTWLSNSNFNRVELSCGVAVDFVARSVRDALDVLRGEKAGPVTLARAVSITESTLRELARAEPAGPAVIVGDKASPAYKNITARMDGDTLRVEFQCSPVIPVNYIPVSIYAVPYSGTASVAA